MIKNQLRSALLCNKTISRRGRCPCRRRWVPFRCAAPCGRPRPLPARMMWAGGDELVAATGTKIVHLQIDGAKPREALPEIAGEKSSSSSMQEAATIMPPATSSRLAVTPPCSMLWRGCR